MRVRRCEPPSAPRTPDWMNSVASVISVVVVLATPARMHGQGRGAPLPAPTAPFGVAQGAPSDSRGAKASAPVDPTGYWVAVVNEDWRYRMVTPAKGDETPEERQPHLKEDRDLLRPDDRGVEHVASERAHEDRDDDEPEQRHRRRFEGVVEPGGPQGARGLCVMHAGPGTSRAPAAA